MGDLFTTRLADCIFNEDHFLVLGEIINILTMTKKMFGMTSLSFPLIHIQGRMSFKFRRSLSYNTLLVTCN
jgi:hypothetical protein